MKHRTREATRGTASEAKALVDRSSTPRITWLSVLLKRVSQVRILPGAPALTSEYDPRYREQTPRVARFVARTRSTVAPPHFGIDGSVARSSRCGQVTSPLVV